MPSETNLLDSDAQSKSHDSADLCRWREDVPHRKRLILGHAVGQIVAAVPPGPLLVVLPDGGRGGTGHVPAHHELDREHLETLIGWWMVGGSGGGFAAVVAVVLAFGSAVTTWPGFGKTAGWCTKLGRVRVCVQFRVKHSLPFKHFFDTASSCKYGSS